MKLESMIIKYFNTYRDINQNMTDIYQTTNTRRIL